MAGARRSSLIGGVCLLLMVGAASAEPPAARTEPLRVVTFNLFHGGASSGLFGDGAALEERLALTIDQLRGLAPDVIALQEASIGRGRGSVAMRIGRALDYYVAQAPASERMFPRWFLGVAFGRVATAAINFNEGPAVLSRWPIVDRRVFDLPHCSDRLLDPRVLLRVRIESPHGPLQVYSTHASGNACELERIQAVVLQDRGAWPGVLMGDLNETDEFPALARFTTRAGFTDAFRAANPRDAGFTDLQRPGSSSPTVSRRYDYVFVVPATGGRPSVLSSRVVLNEPRRRSDGTTIWPSDHYGVQADLDLWPR